MSSLEFVANIKFDFLYASSKCYYLLWLIKPFRVFFIFSSAAVSETLIKSFTCSNDSSYEKHMRKPLCTGGHSVILSVLQHHLWLAGMREAHSKGNFVAWQKEPLIYHYTWSAQRKDCSSMIYLDLFPVFPITSPSYYCLEQLCVLWGRSISGKHYLLGSRKKASSSWFCF